MFFFNKNKRKSKSEEVAAKPVESAIKDEVAKRPIQFSSVELVLGDKVRFTGRPADLIEPEWDKMVAEAGVLARTEEDVLKEYKQQLILMED